MMKAAVGVLNLSKEVNTISTIRTADHFGIRRVFVVGNVIGKGRSCINCHKKMLVRYFNTEEEFVQHIKNHGYKLILIEQAEQSVNIAKYQFPANVVLMTGHENRGFSEYLLGEADSIVHIPNVGLVQCMNTAAAFAIGVYKYFEQRVIA